MTKLKAPFPAFGGKSKVADLVWSRIGDVDNFIEPFCNSAAVLLVRPSTPRVETVNDLNPYIANFWRATSIDPEAVVEACDWPVNETDLHSRHRWLVLSDAAVEFRERMKADPKYFDAEIAGWWVWGCCCWIGGEWCIYMDGEKWNERPGMRPRINGYGHGPIENGINAGASLQARRPVIANPGSDAGKGVHGNPPERTPDAPKQWWGEAYTPNCPRAAPSWPMPTTSAAACAGRRRRVCLSSKAWV